MRSVTSLRVAKTKAKTKSYSLGVPAELGHTLEESGVTSFALEITEDGLLYRPTEAAATDQGDLPGWLKKKED